MVTRYTKAWPEEVIRYINENITADFESGTLFRNGVKIEGSLVNPKPRQYLAFGCRINGKFRILKVHQVIFYLYHGKQAKKIAFQLLDEGLIHVIATDTHRATGSRKPCLNKIFYLLEKKYNYHAIHTLMSENPLHILKNEWLEPVYARESFFKKLAKKLKSK